jgi:HTH-type transcriptional regulator, competence development regulator
VKNNLGEFLIQLRGNKSLREVSKISGLSHSYIRDIERGINRTTNLPIRPSAETLKRLSKAYDFPYEELLLHAGYIENPIKENTATYDEITESGLIEIDLQKILEGENPVTLEGYTFEKKEKKKLLDIIKIVFLS